MTDSRRSERDVTVEPARGGSAISRPRKLLYGLVTAATILVAAELLLRLTTKTMAAALIPADQIYAHISLGELVFHPELGWIWPARPAPGIGQSAQGFRHGEISVDKPPGTWRAFALGDSQTHGAGVTPEGSYPGLTETRLQLLAPPDLRVEFVNASVPGYSSLQCLRLIKLRLLQYEPDLIVINCMAGDSERDDQVPERISWARLNGLLFHSRLFVVLHHTLGILNEDPYGVRDTPRPGRELGKTRGTDGKLYGNHDLIAALAEEEGFDLVFANYPVWDDHGVSISCQAPDSTLPPGVPIARFYEAVTQSGLPGSDLFFDGNHMKLEGNMCAADALVDEIVAIWRSQGILATATEPSER